MLSSRHLAAGFARVIEQSWYAHRPGTSGSAQCCNQQPPTALFVSLGEEGPVSAKLVCAYLACNAQPFNPLLDNMPPVKWWGAAVGLAAPSVSKLPGRRAAFDAAHKVLKKDRSWPMSSVTSAVGGTDAIGG